MKKHIASEVEAFTEFLFRQQPVYDEMILRDIRPSDGWIGTITTGHDDQWWKLHYLEVLRRVRQISENATLR